MSPQAASEPEQRRKPRVRTPKAPSTDTDTLTQSYRYRILPTPEQKERLDAALGASRFWWNQALALVLARLKERDAALEAAGGDFSHGVSWPSSCPGTTRHSPRRSAPR